MNVQAAGLSSRPSLRPEVTLFPDVNEQVARTAPCAICNAPPGAACHQIRWHGSQPRLAARMFHGRRLKDALALEARKQRIAARERP